VAILTHNALIVSATLTTADHGLLSGWLSLDYGGAGQNFGGYSLYLPKGFKHHNLLGPNYAGHFIYRVMQIADVTEWGQLKGKTIRARAEHNRVHAIGHIIKEDWFCPAEDFAEQAE